MLQHRLAPQLREQCDQAIAFLEAGWSLVPLKLDKTKAPEPRLLPLVNGKPSWKPFSERKPTAEEIIRWHSMPIGLGIVAGVVSGGVEVIDFDDGELFWPWREKLPQELAARLCVVETPSDGWHVIYRCRVISGNQKIAMKDVIDQETGKTRREVLIETRGEGGYIVSVISPAAVHPVNRPYVQVYGAPLPEVPIVSEDERKAIWAAARSFDQRPDPLAEFIDQEVKRQKRELRRNENHSSGDVTPWDDFKAKNEWTDVLLPHGWRSTDGIHWTRPGKEMGLSAVVRDAHEGGAKVLVVFSSSAGQLAPKGNEGHRTIDVFQAWCELNHGGDYSKAAKAAREAGYGR